jgi:Terpene synthase family 2, C-terminal metal binding
MTLTIPPLYCPIRSVVNPNVAELNTGGLEWISRFGVYDDLDEWARYADSNPGLLPACVMPNAPMGPALQASANLLFWLWAFDDLVCDENAPGQPADNQVLLLCDLARVVEAPTTALPSPGIPGSPLRAALGDLRRQLDRTATPVQVARWASAMQLYLMSNAAIAVHQTHGTVPDLETYVTLRIHSGAVKPALMMLDVADGYELAPSLMERPDIWALNEMVCTVVGWDNDLLTYHKEVLRGGADHNLVTVLEHVAGCSADKAAILAIAMRDRVLRLFLELRDQTAADAGPELLRYLDGLSAWIRGHLDWGLATARYRNPENPADLPHDFAVTSIDNSHEPLPIVSIAWWWGQLRA